MADKDTVNIITGGKSKATAKFESGPRAYWLRHSSDEKKWVAVAAQTHDHTMRVAGVPAKTFYYEATPFVDAQVAVHSYYGLDDLTLINDVYNFEAEALGQKMIYGKDAMPTIDFRDPLIKKPADLLQLKTPDFKKDGRFPYQMEVFRQSIEIGCNKASFCGPFSLAVGIRSYPLLVRDMRKDPSFYNDLMTFLVDEVLFPYVKAIHDETGIAIMSGADAWAAFPNLSTELIEENVLPWNLRLLQKGAEIGVYAATAGTADYFEERPEKFDADILKKCLELGVRSQCAPVVFMGMGRWQHYPLEPVLEFARELKEKQDKPVMVMAGINARVLRDGPVSEIIRYVKRMIDTFAPEFNLNIFLASIPADTPPAHVHAAVQATHYFGQLPYQFRDEASFKLQERESFAEFMSKIDSL